MLVKKVRLAEQPLLILNGKSNVTSGQSGCGLPDNPMGRVALKENIVPSPGTWLFELLLSLTVSSQPTLNATA